MKRNSHNTSAAKVHSTIAATEERKGREERGQDGRGGEKEREAGRR